MKIRNLLVAIGLALLAAVWLLSGILGREATETPPTLAEVRDATLDVLGDRPMTRVRVQRSRATTQPKSLTLRGRTEIKNVVVVQSQTNGLVTRREVDVGEHVSVGELLCQLETTDREARVGEARAAVAMTSVAYEGALSLQEAGLQGELEIATAKSNLSVAERGLVTAEIELGRTSIRSPIAGIVEETLVNVGDYALMGTPCVKLVDLDPIYITASVSEMHVDEISVGAEAEAVLTNGRTVSGPVTFVGNVASDQSRTFRVEVAVANPEYEIRAGLSAELTVPLDLYEVHKISAALLVLNSEGDTGVRVVNSDRRVEFRKVEIVRQTGDGLWVSGLPDSVVLISVGQEFVSAGERVEISYADST